MRPWTSNWSQRRRSPNDIIDTVTAPKRQNATVRSVIGITVLLNRIGLIPVTAHMEWYHLDMSA